MFVSFRCDFALGYVDVVVNIFCGLVSFVLFAGLDFVAVLVTFACLFLVFLLIVHLETLLAFRGANKISRKERMQNTCKARKTET